MSKELTKALNKVKMDLLTNKKAAFISSIFFSMKFKWDESVPTACVDGITLSVNPDFFLGLPPKVRLFVMVHEAWHIAFKHISRFKYHKNKSEDENKLSFLKYNYAADYVINLQCQDDGFEVWEHALISEDYRDMSTEQIYNLLKDEDDDNFDPDKGDMVMPSPGSADPKEQKILDQQIDQIIMKASTQAEMSKESGSIPGEVQFYIDKLKNPKLPWNVILQKYMNDFDRSDYSFQRPNRRYMPQYYMPTLRGVTLEKLAVAWDLSFSVSKDDVAVMMTEVEQIRSKLVPEITEVVTFDHDIKGCTTLSPHEPIQKVRLVGMGGTDLNALIEYFMKQGKKPNVLVVFTDMADDPCEVVPDFPVIWVAINPHDYWLEKGQPFGEVVVYKSEESNGTN